jgi:hypothetical protein
MLACELFEVHSLLRKQGIIFAYSGYVTEAVLSGVGEAIKQKLLFDDADTKTARSVFAVFVEQMQNMIRYSAETAATGASYTEIRYGVLTIGQENGDYVIHAGNLIQTSDVGRLRRKLSKIRDMNKEELRAVYKEQLRGDPGEGSKGAGLGFMEIARRTSKPIDFDFVDVEDGYAFFTLKASV